MNRFFWVAMLLLVPVATFAQNNGAQPIELTARSLTIELADPPALYAVRAEFSARPDADAPSPEKHNQRHEGSRGFGRDLLPVHAFLGPGFAVGMNPLFSLIISISLALMFPASAAARRSLAAVEGSSARIVGRT